MQLLPFSVTFTSIKLRIYFLIQILFFQLNYNKLKKYIRWWYPPSKENFYKIKND